MATYTQQHTFSNGTTADGGQVNTEITALGASVNSITNDQVASAANIAISKTALGTFTPWTTFAGTFYRSNNSTAITGTVTGARYCQIGKTVFVDVVKVIDDGQDIGYTAYLVLPVTQIAAGYTRACGASYLVNGSNTAGWPVNTYLPTTADRVIYTIGGSVSGAPQSWTGLTSMTFYTHLVYEAA